MITLLCILSFVLGVLARGYVRSRPEKWSAVWGKLGSLTGIGPKGWLDPNSRKLASSCLELSRTVAGNNLLNWMKREFDSTQEPPMDSNAAYFDAGKRFVYKWLCGWIKLGAQVAEGNVLYEEDDSDVRIADRNAA